MDTNIIDTKYFGRLDLEECPILDDECFTLPLDGQDIRIAVNWPIIAPEAFSESERQDFLDCMDSLPHMIRLAKQTIRREFSRRTLFRNRIRNEALRNFAAAAADTFPGLLTESGEELFQLLTPDNVAFAQGPCGEFACEISFRLGAADTPTLCAEFSNPDHISNFYFHGN